MAPWNLSLRQQPYAPQIPSPLNPLSPETSRRHRRKRRSRAVKHEQSPTQRLLRHKAAVAWRLMSPQDGNAINPLQTIDDGAEKNAIEQKEGSHHVCTAVGYPLKSVSIGKCQETNNVLPGIDMEKQAFVDDDHLGDWSSELRQISNVLTTRRLVLTIGLLCVVGVLSAMRLVGRIQGWRT
ncbi:hypothetical protein GGS26DRAFT_220414 [Hypomontagnella submonticulosa]|nr:hypothetical protein GGS26DRAFT_220414 [Hypomontagnella submonticulosa]